MTLHQCRIARDCFLHGALLACLAGWVVGCSNEAPAGVVMGGTQTVGGTAAGGAGTGGNASTAQATGGSAAGGAPTGVARALFRRSAEPPQVVLRPAAAQARFRLPAAMPRAVLRLAGMRPVALFQQPEALAAFPVVVAAQPAAKRRAAA